MISPALDEFLSLAERLSNRSENEAETRHKLIDTVIHGVLGWPRNRVTVEEYIKPGFADYVLTKPNGDQLIFLEAKRSGVYFTLPHPHSSSELSCHMSVQALMSDAAIRAAMTQVRDYCIDSGCEYAAVTNGHEWIFFKTFERGKRWDALRAFVIRGPEFFQQSYTSAVNNFSFTAVTERSSLASLLGTSPPKDRPLFFPKERIPSYSHPIKANRLASALRPLAIRYFGIIGDDDTEFMNRCYVSERDYPQTLEGMRVLIQDSLTPYFAGYNVEQLHDTGRGGHLGGRLKKTITSNVQHGVLVLFGGKGSGKSTFVKRLLLHNPPPWLNVNAVVAVLDLLKVPEKPELIQAALWQGLVAKLDRENILADSRDQILTKLFSDRYDIAQRQELSGLSRNSEAFNTRLNALVSDWKKDLRYCAQRLVSYWSAQGRGVIVVVDNTDQFSGDSQDFCFSSAQEISNQIGCVTLISMREERFHNSKVHGLLDAFQTAGFHISSPRPSHVFRKRLEYTRNVLASPDGRKRNGLQLTPTVARDCKTYLTIIEKEFRNENSPLTKFLTACAHGDTRLSLDMFSNFLLSGYTNVEEILASGSWNFQLHQVVRPVMTPDRYFYDETLSKIPNIYQLRYSRHSSHFTALRILRKLSQAVEDGAAGYMAVAELLSHFTEIFNMADDFRGNMDVLLKHGFIEADNRLDVFSDDVDRVKITNYGLYAFRDLAYLFTYLDLVCTDCAVFDESVSNLLSEAAKSEYAFFLKADSLRRMEVRLSRVESFISYLRSEEIREREFYGLPIPDENLFTTKPLEAFASEKQRVMSSAKRQVHQKIARADTQR